MLTNKINICCSFSLSQIKAYVKSYVFSHVAKHTSSRASSCHLLSLLSGSIDSACVSPRRVAVTSVLKARILKRLGIPAGLLVKPLVELAGISWVVM